MKQLQCVTDIAEDVPSYIKSSPQKLKQIMINLLNSSYQHTTKGQINIMLTKVKQSSPREQIKIAIKAIGLGSINRTFTDNQTPPPNQSLKAKKKFNIHHFNMEVSQTIAKILGPKLRQNGIIIHKQLDQAALV